MPTFQKPTRRQDHASRREQEHRTIIGVTGNQEPHYDAFQRAQRRAERNAGRRTMRMLFQSIEFQHAMMLASVIILVGFGLVMVFSASSVDLVALGLKPWSMVVRQSMFVVIGVVGAVLASRLSVKAIKRLSPWLLALSIFFQLLTLTKLGRAAGGNVGWIQLGSISFQPAELIKLALCLWLPVTIINSRKEKTLWKRYGIAAVALLVSVGSIALGHDMGTASVVVIIGLAALLFGGMPMSVFYVMGGLALVVGAAGVFTSSNRMNRVFSFLSCSPKSGKAVCYQTNHGLFAISSGGLFGLGLGNSREKWSYLPEATNDFIFAIIGEEAGFLCAISVLLLFAVLIASMIRSSLLLERLDYQRLVLLCVVSWLSVQALVNILVVLKLFPVMGVPLPFVSSGGTSMVVCLTAIGACSRMMMSSLDDNPEGEGIFAHAQVLRPRKSSASTSADAQSASRKDSSRQARSIQRSERADRPAQRKFSWRATSADKRSARTASARMASSRRMPERSAKSNGEGSSERKQTRRVVSSSSTQERATRQR